MLHTPKNITDTPLLNINVIKYIVLNDSRIGIGNEEII